MATPADLTNRVQLLERDVRDHAKSLTEMTTHLNTLFDWKNTINLLTAREDERDKALYRRLDEIEKSIEEVRAEALSGVREIKGAASRVQWMIIGAVVVAGVGLFFKTKFGL